MAPSRAVHSKYLQPSIAIGVMRLVAALVLLGALSACSTHPASTRSVAALAPLQLEGRSVGVEAVSRRIPAVDLLATDAAMRDFVAHYTEDAGSARQRLMSLHRAVTGAGILDLQYDPFADGAASEAFHRGTANCLSAASLFVALAREAGLDASYQWLEVRPQWSRMGERVMVGLHVNVQVKLRGTRRYMVDIDPLPSRKWPVRSISATVMHRPCITVTSRWTPWLRKIWSGPGYMACGPCSSRRGCPTCGSTWARFTGLPTSTGRPSTVISMRCSWTRRRSPP